MKRNLYILALVLVLVLSLALTGCSKPCEHEWEDANCEDPKTCELCDETEGAPLGHTWKAATCNAAKTCETCGKVDGEPLGHTWVDATCEDPKTCSACKTEEGEALGHTWVDATTEAPKTCSTCQATEGDPIDVDDRFVTSECEALFGSWSGTITQTSADFGMEDDSYSMTATMTMTFGNDGTLTEKYVYEKDSYMTFMRYYLAEMAYASMEAEGFDRDTADAAFVSVYGMNITEYVDTTLDALTEEDLAEEYTGVYYIEDDTFYCGLDWTDDDMYGYEFTLEGNTLTLDEEYTGVETVLTKDAE